MAFRTAFAFSAFALSATAATASTVVWDFPRTDSCHEGMAFADSVTGVLVWGGEGGAINLTVARADLWDHRGGYDWLPSQSYTNIVALVRADKPDELRSLFRNEVPENWGGRYNPYMLPLGRIVVTVPGAVFSRGELDTSTGIGRLFFADGRIVEMAISKNERAFGMRFPGGLAYEVKTVPATDFPVYEQKLKARGFEKARVYGSDASARGGMHWNLPVDKSVSLAFAKNGSELSVRTWRGDAEPASAVPFAKIRADSVAYWDRFWSEGARVRVPDPVIQQIFDYGMYRFGAMTDPDGVPPGLQGPWLEDDRLVPWNGDYHFNINVQECYSPAYRGGHLKNLLPLFRMVLSWRERMRANAKAFVGIEDGYVLPHSVDDRGVCIGGFWTGTTDHGSTAWVAAMMMRYVRYSGDVPFLKEGAYDFMKGAMNVYCAMMEERDGRLSIPLGPSPEWGGSKVNEAVGRDPSFQLAAAHRLTRDLLEAAALLGETPDPRWSDVKRRLPPYTARPGDGIMLFEKQPFTKSHRHHSHMAGFFPFNTIDDAVSASVPATTYRTWVFRGTGEWSGWCVPWASVLHTHFGSAGAAVHALHSWKTFFNNPGHGSLHDAWMPGYTVFTGRPRIMQMDGACAAASAVMELMAHEVGGKTEFFRGCPKEWKDVSFENLALSDGTRVNGRRVNGKIAVQKVK